MAINLAQLRERLQETLVSLKDADAASVQEKLWEFMQYSIDNYDLLDDEAKLYINRVFDGLRKSAHTIVDRLPEGVQKRQQFRQLGLAGGGHFLAEDLVRILESPHEDFHSILSATKEVFTKLLQNILDVLFDATRHSHEGVANFAKVGLCYWAIDELLAALHLAQRAFTNQAYAHLRTEFEILELVELFGNQPEWAELWASGKDRDVWSELRPSAVRKKLGEPKHDPIYSFFSELGSHGTFPGLQARGTRVDSKGKGNNARFRIWVGGSPQVHHIVWTNSFCVYAALGLLAQCINAFAEYLDANEMKGMLHSAAAMTADFFKNHFVKWAKDEGLDAATVIDFLDKFPGTMNSDDI